MPRRPGRANSARTSGLSRAGRPANSDSVAAYIPARPRADPTPPTEAGPSARTDGVLIQAIRSVRTLKATVCRPFGSKGWAAISALCSGVGFIGRTAT